jgi:TetR/AcrR family transcriptional repressor of nem operon
VSMKEEILQAGVELFWEKGYNASGINEITAAAGVPKGSFYNHFASKEQFAAEVISRYEKQPNPSLDTLTDRSLSPKQRLIGYFDRQIALVESWDLQRGCMLGNLTLEMSDHSPLIRSRLADAFDEWAASIEAVVTEGQESGEISLDMNPGVIARLLLDAWEGALVRARSERDSRSLDSFRFMVNSLIR